MNSPFTFIYEAIMARLKDGLTDEDCRQIDLELGQMESYNPQEPHSKPPLAFPAILIDFETTNFTDLGAASQEAETIILIRICFQQIGSSSDITPKAYRDKALHYLEIEWKIHKLLHDWSPGDGYKTLGRSGTVTEQRPDNYRVRQLRYNLVFTDDSTEREISMTPSSIRVTDG